jgi:hypothetical protein
MSITTKNLEMAEEIVKEIASCFSSTNILKDERSADTIKEVTRQLASALDKFEQVTGETSDGYHTFNELYEHRCLLFINLCLLLRESAYWRKGFEGWPLVGLETSFGQITYHVPEKYLPLFEGKIIKGGPEWDGHTSRDVVDRLTLSADVKGLL